MATYIMCIRCGGTLKGFYGKLKTPQDFWCKCKREKGEKNKDTSCHFYGKNKEYGNSNSNIGFTKSALDAAIKNKEDAKTFNKLEWETVKNKNKENVLVKVTTTYLGTIKQ